MKVVVLKSAVEGIGFRIDQAIQVNGDWVAFLFINSHCKGGDDEVFQFNQKRKFIIIISYVYVYFVAIWNKRVCPMHGVWGM